MSNTKSKDNILIGLPKAIKGWSIWRVAALAVLLLIIAFGAIPNYLGRSWTWQELAKYEHSLKLKNVFETGVTLQSQPTIQQREIQVGGNRWWIQLLQTGQQRPTVMLLRPQTARNDKPEVDWTDIIGQWGWKTDSFSQIKFRANLAQRSTPPVQAKFFRAWNLQQTYAVVQWYAWSTGGGHWAPSHWFWADQVAQLDQNRVGWMAVCLCIPIEPLGEIELVEDQVKDLAVQAQNSILAQILLPS